MKRNARALLPYGAVLAAAFYLLPLLIKDTGSGMLVMLLAIPLAALICGTVYGIRYGFDGWMPLAAAVLFVPAVFIFFNATAWIYIPAYAAIAAIGNGVSAFLRAKKAASFAPPRQ